MKNKKKSNLQSRDTNPSSSSLNGSVRFSIRIMGRVTSISLRKNLVSLWITLSEYNDYDKDTILMAVTNFIYECLDEWEEDSAKGLSDFITERMISEILEDDDFVDYKQISHIL